MGLKWAMTFNSERNTRAGAAVARASDSPPSLLKSWAAGAGLGAHSHLLLRPYSSGAAPTCMCLKTGVAAPSSSSGETSTSLCTPM